MHRLTRRLIVMLAMLGAVLARAGSVRAADEDIAGSFLTPFPEGELYQVAVVGGTFADGLLGGLMESFANDTRLNLPKRTRAFEGIMTQGFEEKLKVFEQTSAAEPAHIVVVMVGEYDRVSLKSSSGRRIAIMSPEWRAEYARRVDRLMKAVKQKNAGVYWVGLPNLGRPEANEYAQGMNEVIRERAYQNGIRFVDAYAGFTDETGAYSAYGPDLAGKIRVLRQADGIHFTEAGNRKLAHFVEKEMRRDLNRARSERNIPLAGNEDEQSKINPDNTVKVPSPNSPAAAGAAEKAETVKPVVTAPSDQGEDQKADNGKITLKTIGPQGREETVQIELMRPAIPASVVALMTRRETSGQMGDLLVDQIGGGVTLMNSVTPAGQKGAGKLSPAQAPYFRLLVKGERLAPKPGRADDFTWSKPETSSSARQPLPPRG